MNLRELYCNHEIKLVGLNGKRRITSKVKGYASMDQYGIITHPPAWKPLEKNINNYGVLCEYIEDANLFYSVIDIDSKDFLVMQVLEEYPTAMTKTNHGYHLHYLSREPVRIKQLSGKDKETCPVDIRGQRSLDKEGNYIRLSKLIGDSTPLLVCDFNDVIRYVYGLFGIEARKIGEHEGNIEDWNGKAKKFIKSKVSNKEYFIASYLFYQKNDWSSAYDSAFPWGVMLKGTVNEEEAYNIAKLIMSLSGYPRPKKWVKSFMTGFTSANDGKAKFNKESLPGALRGLFERLNLNDLSHHELGQLAEQCKDFNLQDSVKYF